MRRFLARHQLILGAGVLILGILAVFAYTSWEDRQTDYQNARKASQNVLALLTRDLNDELRSLDMALQGVVQELQQERLRDLPPELRHLMLFRGVATRSMGSILVFDHQGNIIEDQTSVTPRTGKYADRDYFKIHSTDPNAGLYISDPFKSRLHGTHQIVISRRVSAPDGSFAGVVGASISLASVADRFKDLALGQASTITLYRNDGTVLVRQPFAESIIGRDLSGTPNFERFVALGSGSVEGTAVTDGVRRQFEFSPVGRHPLILSVALSVADIYAHWWKDFAAQSVITGLLCGAIIVLVFMFQRELTRRTCAEAKLGRLALTDDLTGLPNRRAFREAFAREWEEAIRRGTPVSLLYIDADWFKQYNDRYGHGKGDDLLRAIAGVLRAHVTGDREIASRYGGEEFLILLPNSNEGRARATAEHIREAVMKLHVPHDRSPFGRMTVSIGVGTAWPEQEMASDTLRQAADEALYQAKGAGRNCIRGAEKDRNGLNVIPFGKK
jgi:diguanylate cyclase (GGDEF)-like protein